MPRTRIGGTRAGPRMYYGSEYYRSDRWRGAPPPPVPDYGNSYGHGTYWHGDDAYRYAERPDYGGTYNPFDDGHYRPDYRHYDRGRYPGKGGDAGARIGGALGGPEGAAIGADIGRDIGDELSGVKRHRADSPLYLASRDAAHHPRRRP